MIRRPPRSTLFPYTPLSRSHEQPAARLRRRLAGRAEQEDGDAEPPPLDVPRQPAEPGSRSTRQRARLRRARTRSEEHTSELQSLAYLVCRLLLEKKK